jgi:hypothetical protein
VSEDQHERQHTVIASREIQLSLPGLHRQSSFVLNRSVSSPGSAAAMVEYSDDLALVFDRGPELVVLAAMRPWVTGSSQSARARQGRRADA